MSEFEELATCLTCSRGDFSKIFDQTRKLSDADTLPFMIVARGIGPDSANKALATALEYANDKDWLTPLWNELGAAGYISESPPEEIVTRLQQLCSDRPRFSDIGAFSVGMPRRQKQICLIDIDSGSSSGSGFLVGPNAVITSGHVIMKLLDNKDQPSADSHTRIKIKFDHLSNVEKPLFCNVLKEKWLLDYSPPHAIEARESGLTTTGNSNEVSSLVDYLDYAIIGLATCPGNERGFVNLKDPRQSPGKGARWTVLQHPEAFEQQFAQGEFEGFLEKTNNQRVLYSIDTLPGSSGALVVDNDFNFMALHQGARGARPELNVNASKMNTGIAAEAIRKVAKDVQTPDPSAVLQFRRSNDTGPIIGRSDCQQWIHKSRLGSPRIIHIHTRGGTKGASFSTEIMRACLPESEHTLTCISAGELGIEAIDTARKLLERMGIYTAEQLPDPASAETTSAAWIKAALLPVFRERVNQSSEAKLHWLVIDNIDSQPLPDSGVRLFLEALYADIESMPGLRIVLIGLKQRPSSASASLSFEEVIKAPEPEEIESYICMRYVENQIDWNSTSGETERLARLVDRTSSSEIVALDEHIKQNVDPMIMNSTQDN